MLMLELRRRAGLGASVAVLAAIGGAQARVDGWTIQRVSVSDTGAISNGTNDGVVVSGDGRFVGFSSTGSNLVPNDTNGVRDGFLVDWRAHHIERVTVGSADQQTNGSASIGKPSFDGRFVPFGSKASNLDPADPDSIIDGYIRDRQTHTTILVSPRFVAGVQKKEAFLQDMSADGRFAVLATYSEDLIPGDTNGYPDIYVFDTQTRTYQIASTNELGEIGNYYSGHPSISPDGRYVGFYTSAWNLVPFFGHSPSFSVPVLKDLLTGEIDAVHVQASGKPSYSTAGGTLAISRGGRFVAYETFGYEYGSIGGPYGFMSAFVRDMHRPLAENAGLTVPGGRANHDMRYLTMSADTRFVAMSSPATNVTPVDGSDSDVFLRDRTLETTMMLNLGDQGQLPNEGVAPYPKISDDGLVGAFESNANNLIKNSPAGGWQIYVVSRDFSEPGHYCSTVPTPTGCTLRIDSTSLDGPERPSGPALCIRDAPTASHALLCYSINGPAMLPYGASGWLCIRAPFAKLGLIPSGTCAPCGAEFAFDFANWIDSGADPQLVPGGIVYLQAWVSDPSHTSHGTLTDALAFRLQP
ncbi:MAG: hypothetical protein IT459_21910 [Planctomycetes bacterium]|nr:hypothetical protein [Planctomycetota bacterium]